MSSATEASHRLTILSEHQNNHKNISRSLLALKHNKKLYEGTVIERQKQKIQHIAKVIASNSVHQRVVLPKIGKKTPEKLEKVMSLETSAMHTPGLNRVFNCKLNTCWKPAHRYKTSMVEYSNKLYLYGGLGCEKLLTWACFDLASRKWSTLELDDTIANLQNKPRFPRYSHTTVQYKNKAYIYGGFMVEICSQLTIFDFDKLEYDAGSRGPARRDHAAAVLGKFMLIHGGISHESAALSNDFNLYNLEQDCWCELKVFGCERPALSHHKLASTAKKYRKPNRYNENCASEEFYMFGGKTQEGTSVNTLYRIRLEGVSAVRVEKVDAKRAPMPRFEHCLEFVQTGYLVVHGGKTHEETSSKRSYRGVFHDIHLFDTTKEIWLEPTIGGYPTTVRFGMASVSIGSAVVVFGGCNASHFHDGDLYQIETDPTKANQLQQLMNQQIPYCSAKEGQDRLRSTITKLLNKNKLR